MFGLEYAGHAVEVVVHANAFAATALGIAGYATLGLSVGVALALGGAAFCALSLALLNRFTRWISISLGSLVVAVFPALLLAGLGLSVLDKLGAWLGGALGAALGVRTAFAAYSEVFRSVSARDK